MIDAWLAYEAVEAEAFGAGPAAGDGSESHPTGGRMIDAAAAAKRMARRFGR